MISDSTLRTLFSGNVIEAYFRYRAGTQFPRGFPAHRTLASSRPAMLVRYSPPTREQIFDVAREAISIFTDYGLESCLVGGTACAVYGAKRTPSDVDIVVFTSKLEEADLQQILVKREDSQFYVTPSRTPGASYKVLWYRLGADSNTEDENDPGEHCACKVDILRPGVMNIPHVPPAHIVRIDGIPLMPLFTLLILKLEAWNDHRNAYKYYVRMKRHVDAKDLEELLPLTVNGMLWTGHEEWVRKSRIRTAENILREYLVEYPKQKVAWEALGLET